MLDGFIKFLSKIAGVVKIWFGIEILRDGKPTWQVKLIGGVEKEGINVKTKDD